MYFKRSVFMVFFTLLGASASAEYSESAFSSYDHAAWGSIGFTEGGLALGGDYEYAADRTFGIGGLTRFYQEDEDRGAPGIFLFGGYVRPHFHRRSWDLFLTAGMAIISIDDEARDEEATSLGPVFGVGVLYQVTKVAAIGVESLASYIWFDEDFRGQVMEDVMFRVRFSF
ncbi:MAG: outer membrane beta-barrel protein [Pseudomonadota bacterium]